MSRKEDLNINNKKQIKNNNRCRIEKPVNAKIEFKNTEMKIHELEDELKIITEKLELPVEEHAPGKIKKLKQKYLNIQEEISMLIKKWEELSNLI